MKYPNARDLFPDALLKQIQKYVSGQTIYIPAAGERKAWGETSGYKRYIIERNVQIRNQFKSGTSIDLLADRFSLSPESIRKIVYSKKEVFLLDYQCTLSSAQAYARAGKLEQWVHTYLLSDGHNQAFSDGLKLFDRYFLGPVTMPLSLFRRCCGPEEEMTYRVDGEWFEQHVKDLTHVLQTKEDLPPLIVHYTKDGFELNDGNHRLEACKRLGITEYPVIVWITAQDEYDAFMEAFGNRLQ